MNKTEFEKAIREKVQRKAQEAFDSLDKRIESILGDCIFDLMGLRREYGRTEIDHCNGRKTVLEALIKEKAQGELEKVMKGFKLAGDDRSWMAEAFQKEFKSQFGYEVRSAAQSKARQTVSIMFDKLTESELKKMGFEGLKKD